VKSLARQGRRLEIDRYQMYRVTGEEEHLIALDFGEVVEAQLVAIGLPSNADCLGEGCIIGLYFKSE